VTALLDTNAFLWWIANRQDRRIGKRAREILEDDRNDLWVSAASAWEISIKARLRGPEALEIRTAEPPDHYLRAQIQAHHFCELPVEVKLALRVYEMTWHHDDPFDLLLIAQCIEEGLPILTSDGSFENYPVSMIWR
jgi:PIN domain nuclease of toxin-antitoxin system